MHDIVHFTNEARDTAHTSKNRGAIARLRRDLHRRAQRTFQVINGLLLSFDFCFFLGPLNKTIIILFGIYAAGGFAAFFRSWLYTLAGQRLVARLRKKVSINVALKIFCRFSALA